MQANPLNWNISVSGGKDINWDSASSDERTQTRPMFKSNNWNTLESVAIAGDSPVWVKSFEFLSKAGHVKSCLNMGGPPSKPKYSYSTDSEQVPWGKGQKNPDEGSEIEPEIGCLQAVRGDFYSWWRTSCIMGQRLNVCSKLKPLGGGVAKASVNSATSCTY